MCQGFFDSFDFGFGVFLTSLDGFVFLGFVGCLPPLVDFGLVLDGFAFFGFTTSFFGLAVIEATRVCFFSEVGVDTLTQLA